MGDTIASRSEQTIPFSGCVAAAAASPSYSASIASADDRLFYSGIVIALGRGKGKRPLLVVELMQKEGLG